MGILCDFAFRLSGGRTTERLWAAYEVDGVWIGDDFTPEEIVAEALLARWGAWAAEAHPSGIIPINWHVVGAGIIEGLPGMPHSHDRPDEREDFLTFFTHPIRVDTGEPLRWTELPVRDRNWTERGDRGGFIQEVTGWRPGILQPFVLLDHLIGFRTTARVRGAEEVWEFVRGQRGTVHV